MRFLILQQKNCLSWVLPIVESAAKKYGHSLVKWTSEIKESDYDGVLCFLQYSYELSELCLYNNLVLDDNELILGRGIFEGLQKHAPHTYLVAYKNPDAPITLVTGLIPFRNDVDIHCNDYTAWGRIIDFDDCITRDMESEFERLQNDTPSVESGNDFLLLM